MIDKINDSEESGSVIMNKLKWLYPGIGVKRWFFLILTGLLLVSAGIAIVTRFHFISYIERFIFQVVYQLTGSFSVILTVIFALIMLAAGILLIAWSLRKIVERVNQEFLPDEELVDFLYNKELLKKGPAVVAIGGGTGLSNLLRGLKKFTSNITAIVTVADDGGSSGKLRDEMGILPPGDIRNCLVALADKEPLMEKLFQYRFSNEGHLVGHSFGNLFIASMTEVLGDFEGAIKESSKVLAIKGQVLPATKQDVRLGAIYADKSTKMGESVIPSHIKKIERVFLKPNSCKPTPEALTAIEQAGVIAIGPGSLYTSILPNLLVDGIVEAIKESNALKIYICNVMTQPGETTDYTAGDHLQAIYEHIGDNIFDYIVVNKGEGSRELEKRYEEEGAYPVIVDTEKIEKYGLEILKQDLLTKSGYIRHDPQKIAQVIQDLAERR